MVQFFRCPLSRPKFGDASGNPPDVVALVSSEVPRQWCTKDREKIRLEQITPIVYSSYWL